MARIAFITERLPPHLDPIAELSYSLILQLADQQHDIQIFTTYREGEELPTSHPRIQILRPLRKWNWLEVPRWLALMLDFRPDILHVIDPHSESLHGFTHALNTLPRLIPLMGSPKLIVSFFDLDRRRLRKISTLIANSSFLTVINRAQHEVLQAASLELRLQPEIKMLPAPAHRFSHGALDARVSSAAGPVAASSPWTHESQLGAGFSGESSHLLHFLRQNENLIFVPGDLDLHQDPEALVRALSEVLTNRLDTAVLVGGDWGSMGALRRRRLMQIFESAQVGERVLITGRLDPETELVCLRASRFAWLATLREESLSLTRMMQRSLLAETVILLSHGQAERDARPWTHGKSALISDAEPTAWVQLIHTTLDNPQQLASVRAGLPDFAREQTLDQPGNIMSRWYTELTDRAPARKDS